MSRFMSSARRIAGAPIVQDIAALAALCLFISVAVSATSMVAQAVIAARLMQGMN